MASCNSLLFARLALLLFSPFLALAVLLLFVGLSTMMLFEVCNRGFRACFHQRRSASTR